MRVVVRREVERYALMIYDVIYDQKTISGGTAESEIIKAGKELHDIIKKDLEDKILTFVEKIKHDSVNMPTNLQQLYLKECLSKLMTKLTPRASWHAYGHILLCISLIRQVAKDYEFEQNPQFQSDIKATYCQFILQHFTEFIASMGGFGDIVEYIQYRQCNYTFPISIRLTVALSIAIAGIMLLAKKE